MNVYSNISNFVIDHNFRVIFSSGLCKMHNELNEGDIFDIDVAQSNKIFKYDPKLIINVCHNVFKDKLNRTLVLPTEYNNISLLVTIYIVPLFVNNTVVAVLLVLSRFDAVSGIDELLKKKYLHKYHSERESKYNAKLPAHKEHQNIIQEKIKLSELEECIIYLLLKNFSSFEIAEICSGIFNKKITKANVDKIIQIKLRNKFNAYNRIHLTDILVRLGYSAYVPNNILQSYTHETIYFINE